MKQKVSMADRVMQKIHKDNIEMKPGYYFEVREQARRAGFLLFSALSIFLINLVFFKFRIYNPFGFMALGSLGFNAFVSSIPWLIMFGVLVSLSAVILIIKKFDFSYKTAYPGLVFAMLVFFAGSGLVLSLSGFNEQAKKAGKADIFYHGEYSKANLQMGEVVLVDENSHVAVLKVPYSTENPAIAWDSSTVFASEKRELKPGQYVQAVGDREGKIFHATGIVVR